MRVFFVAWIVLCSSLFLKGQSIDRQVDSLLQLMTLEEKVGQMTQVERTALSDVEDLVTYNIGSILSGGGSAPSSNSVEGWANMYDEYQLKALQSRLKIPLIYGIDAVHGHNNVENAVIFPHNIGLGCTRNPDLVKRINESVAIEVAATGIDWTFAPCIAVPRDEKWGRTYEGFGETPELQKMMAKVSIEGLQGEDLKDESTVLACAKHFVGDGGTESGIDQGNTIVSEDELRGIHMPGYIEAIDAGVGTIMASFNSWNGDKLHGNKYLLTDVLKEELGFEGFVISDWKGVDQVDSDYRTAIKKSINAGIDMVMVPNVYEVFIGHLISLVNDGEVSEARIDDAVRRILKQKFALNLFEEPYSSETYANDLGKQEHREIARQAVRESLVLLDAKNDVLPLKRNGQKILVAGSLADDVGGQCGGWTISWQGQNGNIIGGTSILRGLENSKGGSQVIFSPNGNYTEEFDIAVVVIGEKEPYAEGAGDRTNLNLEEEDILLVKKLKGKGVPVVSVIISGRPLLLNELTVYSDAILAAWYPGTEGEGIAEVLFGDYDLKGKLSHSWPKTMDQIPINVGDNNYDPMYPYDHGLSRFPTYELENELRPLGGSTNEFGDVILLSVSDQITSLDVDNVNFTLFVDGEIIPDAISRISWSQLDSSVLSLELVNSLSSGQSVRLSYNGSGVFSNDIQLEVFDQYFVYNAVRSGIKVHGLPGRIEAEEFYEMVGVEVEDCDDVGGGLNVGFIDEGDWLKYRVEVNTSGNYLFTMRHAGFDQGEVKVSFNELAELNLKFSGTGGWQNWDQITKTVYLNAGVYEMYVEAKSTGFNINYFDVDILSNTNNYFIPNKFNLNVYPNPALRDINVHLEVSSKENISVSFHDLSGKMNHTLFNGAISPGNYDIPFSLPINLPTGTYFIQVNDGRARYFEKVIIK